MTTKKTIVGLVILMVISMAITSSLAQTCTETLTTLNGECKGGDTVLDSAICCADYNVIVTTDPQCFCGVLFAVYYLQPTADLEAVFTKCPIPGSFKDLCLEP
ncbi:hypothetical protein RND81_13G049700 [Saponaria officinalis]|uniref:Bifunctional inhibitor/plant lipid transfer protein/seed storage helical domain-containing protein n=1 Tax=Saponaria officinalis TaxID=3572 RepID=A0AAW1GZN1_SAPOF